MAVFPYSIGVANISDIHFRDNWAERLYRELRENFLDVLELNIENIHLINILGDLFHQKLLMTGQGAYYCSKFIQDLIDIAHGIPIRIIVGTRTHDYNQPKIFRYLPSSANLKIYDKPVIEKFSFFEKEDFAALYIPEEYPANWKDYYRDFLIDNEYTYDAIFMHGMVDFMAHPSLVLESEDIIQSSVVFPVQVFKENAVVAVGGHVHVAESCENFYYCGSFSRWCYGEEKPKGWIFLEYDIDKRKYKIEFAENDLAPEYKTIKLSSVYKSGDKIEKSLDKISRYIITNKIKNLRIKCDLENSEETVQALSVLREHYSQDDNYNVSIFQPSKKSTKNETPIEETEIDKKESEIAYSQKPIEEKIQEWITLKHDKDVPLQLIRETIGNSKITN